MSKKIAPVLNSDNSGVRNRNKDRRFTSIKHVYEEGEANEKLFIVYDKKVYDLTKFQYEHPGGSDVLEDSQGQDIYELFHNSARHRHSQYALNLMQKYQIGEIGEPLEPTMPTKEQQQQQNSSKEVPSLTPEKQLIYKSASLDLSKGLLHQIYKLKGKAEYAEMLSHPCKQQVATRLFDNEALDSLCNNNIGVTVLVYGFMLVYLLMNAYDKRNLNPRGLFDRQLSQDSLLEVYRSLLFMLGLFLFWILEFFFLRVVLQPFALGRTLHFFAVGAHYLFPLDKTRTTVMPAFSLATSFVIGFMFDWIVSGVSKYWVLSGICTGYLLYEMIHYALHAKKELTMTYSQNLRVKHSKHHFKDRNYGHQVTNHFWDKFFQMNDLDEEDAKLERIRLKREKVEEERRRLQEQQKQSDSSDSD